MELTSSVPGLALVWRDAHWRVYAVAGAPGLVSGPARLLRSAGSDVLLDVTGPGSIVVRERYVDAWQVTRGHAKLSPGPAPVPAPALSTIAPNRASERSSWPERGRRGA